MTPRWAGFTAPFRWLIDAVDVGRHQPQTVIGAIAAVTLIGFLPSLPQQALGAGGTPPGIGLLLAMQAVAFAFGLLVMPVLRAGVYRILDGAERGDAMRVGQIFDGFRDGSYGRIVAFTALSLLLFFAIALVMLIAIAVLVGPEAATGLQAWTQQIMALQAEVEKGVQIQPDQLPPLPEGVGAIVGVMLAFLPLWLVVGLGSGWGLVSVALRGTGPVEALISGLRAAMTNAAPVLAMAFLLLVPGGLLAMLVVLVFGGIAALFTAISPALGMAVTGLLLFGLGVVVAAIGYGFVLNGWRAALDDAGSGPTEAAPLAGFEA